MAGQAEGPRGTQPRVSYPKRGLMIREEAMLAKTVPERAAGAMA